jgi:hypothetical protein
MARIKLDDLKKHCAAIETHNGALLEYTYLSINAHHVPDAKEIVIVEGEEHVFSLFGARRASGGVLLHTTRLDGALSPEVMYFEDACQAWRVTSYHTEAWKIRDALDRLMLARKVILDAERAA